MRILLVEDGPYEADGFARHFEARGHTVDRAATGDKAITLLAGGPYDAAAIDLVLPASTGDVVAIEATRRGVGVVLMSAASPEHLADLSETLLLRGCRVSEALHKAITPEQLLAALERAASQRETSDGTPG